VRNLPEARVARLAECHTGQKAGYNHHASPFTVTHAVSSQNTPTILNILIQMKNNARSDYTIQNTSKSLRYLDKHADLNQPEQVKQFIASIQTSTSYKRNLAIAYNKYVEYSKLQWIIPRYKQQAKSIKIPTEEKLNMLIAHARRTMALKLTISKETGLRPIELCNLKVRDVCTERKLIYPTTAKHGKPRALKISDTLQNMLQAHITAHKLNTNDQLFKGDAQNYGKYYRDMRNNLANKLQDQTIRTIRLYDFRHHYATMLYHKTRDILYVKQQMGHAKVDTTLIYTQLLDLTENEEYTCKTATNAKEDQELLEAGFEYVTDRDGLKIYRKRK
jgi:integrase